MTTVLAIAAYATALTGSFLLVRWLSRIALWAQTFEGCRGCHVIAQVPYWRLRNLLLRTHLRRISRSARSGEREAIS